MIKQIKLLVFLFLLISCSAYGIERKNKFETKIGYGYYQGFNIGLNYFYTKRLKVGFEIGSYTILYPNKNDYHFNIQIENTLHFGNLNKQNVGGWYFNQQIMYWESGRNEYRWKVMSLGLNLGKTISITKRIGLDFELGPAFNFHYIKRGPLVEKSLWMWYTFFNGRVQVTYKF